jgi:hypothetical protein
MRFISIFTHEPSGRAPTQAEMAAMGKLIEDAMKEGWLLSTEGVSFGAKGVRVHKSTGGKVTVTDGPFTEAKEVIGGYWLIDVRSREEAIEWATRCRASDNEVIEVRQVHEVTEYPPEVQAMAGNIPEMQTKP